MNLILAILGMAALIWLTIALLRGPLVTGCFLLLFASCCFGVDFLQFDLAGKTWSLDRLFLVGLVVAYIVQSKIGRTDPKPLARTEWLMALFGVLLVSSTFTHNWQASDPAQGSILMHLLNGYAIPLVIYWIARQASLDQRQVLWGHALLAIFGVYLVVTAVCEVTGQWSYVYPRYIADPDLGIHFGRARGPMLQSVRLGICLVISLVATWLWLAWQAKLGRIGQLLAVIAFPAFALAIYLTYTRSVWLGAALAVFMLFALTFTGRWRLLFMGSVVTAAILLVVVKGNDLVAFKREYSAAETRESTYMRASFAYVSLQMFLDRPLTGFGFGQFPRANRPYLSDRSNKLHLESIRGYVHHNTYLSLLVELGIFGLLFYVLILVAWGGMGWQLWHNLSVPTWARAHGLLMMAAIAVYACQMMFHDVTHSPIENSILFLLAGISSGLCQRVVIPSNCEGARIRSAPPELIRHSTWHPASG